MSITTKALQFALEAQYAQEPYLAQAIIEAVDIGSLGVNAADKSSTSHLITTFIDVGLLSAAVKTIEYSVKRKQDFDDGLVIPLLRSLAKDGDWHHYNSLLQLIAESAQLKNLPQFIHHLLNQLELEKAAELIRTLEQKIQNDDFIEPVALLIAEQNYSEAENRFSADPHLIEKFLDHSSLRHWLYLFLSNVEEKWAVRTLHVLADGGPPSHEILDNYAHFLKLCWAQGWSTLCEKTIQSIRVDLPAELLREHLVFCRVYVFSCQKFRLSNVLVRNLINFEFGVFSEAEIWSIEFKDKIIKEGIERSLTAEFGEIDKSEIKQKTIILPLIIYGSEYIHACRDYFIKSALAAEDFMALAHQFHFTIRVCTDPESVFEIEKVFSPLSNRGFHIEIKRGVFPHKDLPHKRMWPYLDALYTAEITGGIFLSLCPDAIFGDGLGKLIDNCPEGGGAGGGLFRASWSGAEKSLRSGELEAVLCSGSKNRDLAQLGISKWQHYSHRLFFENLSPNYVTHVDNGVRLNSWQGTPSVIRPAKGLCEQILNRAFYRYSNTFADHICQDLDHEFIGVLNSAGLLHMVESYDDFVFVELAKDTGYSQLWKFQLPMGFQLPTPTGNIFPYMP